MASDLIIGPLDPEIEKQVARICKRIAVRDWPLARNKGSWLSRLTGKPEQQPAVQEIMISVIRISSIGFFDDYVASLEGISGPDAMMRTTFRNLPWWMECVWLPIAFDLPRDLIAATGGEMFVGSGIRLLSELDRIKNLSKIDVELVPPGYADMRSDYKAWFWAPDPEPLSDDDVIRWLWRAFREAAEISIDKKVPVLLAI